MKAAASGAADWQQGYSLRVLKGLAGPFWRAHKALVFGAFGLTKERDIAVALKEHRMVWNRREGDGRCKAAAIFRRLRSHSTQRDFTGREIRIPRGDLVVSAFAADDEESGRSVLQHFMDRAGSPVWFEIFEEDEVARALMGHNGFEYVGTKVMAGSEVKGLYVRGRPREFPNMGRFEAESLACLSPVIASPHECEAAVAEIDAYHGAAGDPWAQHYSSYNKRHSWTAFAMRGYMRDDPGFVIKPAEMSRAWKSEHPALMAAECVDTVAAPELETALMIAARIPGPKQRVRFMRLARGGGELSRHADITDREAGIQDGRVARLHIPLRTSHQVVFHSWSARGQCHHMHFRRGGLYYLDTRKPHRVTNDDPRVDRIHLVVDAISGPELRAMLP